MFQFKQGSKVKVRHIVNGHYETFNAVVIKAYKRFIVHGEPYEKCLYEVTEEDGSVSLVGGTHVSDRD